MRPTTLEAKFARGYKPGAAGQCWPWTAGCDRDGYGQIKHGGTTYRAHRVSYERSVGAIPDGLVLDHRCANRPCVNPAHLRPVTNRANILRGTGVPARNARKTHCKHGHEFTDDNTYTYTNARYPYGRRVCKTCVSERAGYPGPESR